MDVVPVQIVPIPEPGSPGPEPAPEGAFADLWAALARLLAAEAGAPEDLPVLPAGPEPPGADLRPGTAEEEGGAAGRERSESPGSAETGRTEAETPEGAAGVEALAWIPLFPPVPAPDGAEASAPPADPAAVPGADSPGGSRPLPESVGREAPAAAGPRAERLWGFWLRRARAASAGGIGGEPPEEGRAAENGRGPGAAASPEGPGGGQADRIPPAGPFPAPAARGPGPEDQLRAEAAERSVPAAAGPSHQASAAAQKQAPARPAPPRPPDPPPPADQVARAVRVAIRTGSDRLTVRLEPEHLGRVHVEVAREAGGLSAHIRVETPQAHQLLANEIPALRAAAESRQVPLVQVAVEFDRGDGRPGDRPDPRRRGRRGMAPEPLDDEPAVRSAWMPWGFETRI